MSRNKNVRLSRQTERAYKRRVAELRRVTWQKRWEQELREGAVVVPENVTE